MKMNLMAELHQELLAVGIRDEAAVKALGLVVCGCGGVKRECKDGWWSWLGDLHVETACCALSDDGSSSTSRVGGC
eukprot:6490651-Amphidinium_carterae.4